MYCSDLYRHDPDEWMKDVVKSFRIFARHNRFDTKPQRSKDQITFVYSVLENGNIHKVLAHSWPLRSHTGEHEPHRTFLHIYILEKNGFGFNVKIRSDLSNYTLRQSVDCIFISYETLKPLILTIFLSAKPKWSTKSHWKMSIQ